MRPCSNGSSSSPAGTSRTLELPRGLTAAELAGGFGLPAALSLSADLKKASQGDGAAPMRCATLLLVAAADPTGDLALVGGRLSGSASGVSIANRRIGRVLGVGGDGGIPSSSRSLGCLPGIRTGRAERGPPCSGGSDRWRERPRSPLVAPGAGRIHADEEVAAELEGSAARAEARGGFAALRRSSNGPSR